MASYGASLPDSEPLVHQRTTTHLALLPSFASFLTTLSALNRDYVAKAASHIGSFRLQVARTAQERGGDQASTERALSGVLEQVDLQVRMSGIGYERTAQEVAAKMDEVGARLDAHHHFYAQLMTQRDKAYEQRDRSRAAYFSACEAVESARQKRASAKEGRDTDKASRVYDAAYSEMLLAKDQYLVDLDAANVAKQRIYSVHLPHLIDEFQQLEASGVKQLEDLLARMLELQTESAEKVMQVVDKAKEMLAVISIEADQQMFVDQHGPTLTAAYEHPPDLVFEECPVWHDTDAFATTPAAITYLQNLKSKAHAKLGDISPAIETKRREVGSLQNLRDTYESSSGLGDTVGVIENLYNVSHETALLELQQSELQGSVELLDATLGDEAQSDLRPHEFKHSSFVTPQTCAVCSSSVWGKGLKCTKCDMAAHPKCELKVPAGCAARPGAGVIRGKSKRMSGAPPAAGGGAANSSTTSLARTSSTLSGRSSLDSSAAGSTAPSTRRSVPPAFGSKPSPVSSPPPIAARPPPPAAAAATETATLLYDFAPSSESELACSAGEVVEVLEPEDENGWLRCRSPRDGGEGLVPASYVQMGGALADGGEDRGGADAAQRAEALYAYEPQSDAELSLVEGETVELTATGMDAGEGWAEVTKSGRTGLVPAAYIHLL
ncbi:Protein BZZ1 [Rhodotorula sphaerocarpa]